MDPRTQTKRKPKDSAEVLAEKHLSARFSKVVYEPQPNRPPDFLIDNRIAVEVRRLNQNNAVDGSYQGLEETAIPLAQKIENFLEQFGPTQDDKSWFVTITFERPILHWKNLRQLLHTELEAFLSDPNPELRLIAIDEKFRLQLIRASIPQSTRLVFGGMSDLNSGGWIVSEVDRNLRICVEEKSAKISSLRASHSEWWLALEDRIGYSLSEVNRRALKDSFDLKHDWDKIILIDPRNHLNFFEV